MTRRGMKLAAFLALAQHEVQQTLEYLAQPQLREVSAQAPSQVLATVGSVKLTVPVAFQIAQTEPRKRGRRGLPAELLEPGMPWPAGSRTRYQLNVRTLAAHQEERCAGRQVGSLQIEFMTVLKQ